MDYHALHYTIMYLAFFLQGCCCKWGVEFLLVSPLGSFLYFNLLCYQKNYVLLLTEVEPSCFAILISAAQLSRFLC